MEVITFEDIKKKVIKRDGYFNPIGTIRETKKLISDI